MNVLIIDNDSEDTDIFREALLDVMPSAICTVTNKCSEIQLLLSSLPQQQYIFLDAHMNPESSLRCAATLFAIIDTRQTSVIVHTGSLSPAEETQFLSLGVYEILLKANTFCKLKEDLRRLLIDSNGN